MSYFYGYLRGNRGETTRAGSQASGIRAHLRSWVHDCYAWLYDENGTDVFKIEIPKDIHLVIYTDGNTYNYEYNKLTKEWTKIKEEEQC